jgi:hypothetical protein
MVHDDDSRNVDHSKSVRFFMSGTEKVVDSTTFSVPDILSKFFERVLYSDSRCHSVAITPKSGSNRNYTDAFSKMVKSLSIQAEIYNANDVRTSHYFRIDGKACSVCMHHCHMHSLVSSRSSNSIICQCI